jgi:hypothetical protein
MGPAKPDPFVFHMLMFGTVVNGKLLVYIFGGLKKMQ